MLYKRAGFPEESELVLCTVSSVQHHSVFVNLDEYPRKSGIIHISEVSPGRIRNIRDYVVEGKKVICKVLKVNEERGHIDLSLRRVNTRQKKEKNNQIKHEQLAEKIIEFVAKEIKKPLGNTYEEISSKIFKQNYDYVYPCFEDIVTDQFSITKLGLDKKIEAKLLELVKQRIKPPEVVLNGVFNIVCYETDGVSVIKAALEKAQKEGVTLSYKGAGKYTLAIKAEDYKTAEGILEEVTQSVIGFIEDHDAEASFERIESK